MNCTPESIARPASTRMNSAMRTPASPPKRAQPSLPAALIGRSLSARPIQSSHLLLTSKAAHPFAELMVARCLGERHHA